MCAATVPFRYTDLVRKYGWDIMPRLSALGIQNLADAQFLFVDSGATNTLDADDGYHGHSLETPLATIDYAVGLCTASEQSVILVAPGHAETHIAASACVTCDVAGVKIIGIGGGTLRPTITLSTDVGAIAFSVTAANVVIENVKIVVSVDNLTKAISVAATDCTLTDVEVADNVVTTEADCGILTTTAAHRLRITRYKHNGFLAGDACARGIGLVGVDDCIIQDSWFIGAFASAAIHMLTTACGSVVVKDCVFENGTTALTADIVDAASSKWAAINCWDAVGSYKFSGGDAAALASDDVSAVTAAIAVVDGQTDKIDLATIGTPVSNSLASFIASGGTALGQALPASTSLVDIIGDFTGPHNGTVYDDNIFAAIKKLSTYIADGDGDFATGTALPTNLSLYDIVKVLSKATGDSATHAYPDAVVQQSIMAYLMSKSATPVATSYDNQTDSLEAISDAVGVADGVADTILVDTAELQPRAANVAAKTLTNLSTFGNFNLFTVTGPVKVTSIVGIVANTIKTAVILCKIQSVPTAPGNAVDITSTTSINAAAIGTTLTPGATFGSALEVTANGAIGNMGFEFVMSSGVIRINTDVNGDADDSIIWYVRYEPLSATSTIVPA